MRNISIIDAYTLMFLRWRDFQGKSSRAEFWYAFLANYVLSIIVAWISSFLFGSPIWLAALFTIVTFVPMFSLSVRRINDTGHKATPAFIYAVGLVVTFITEIVFTAMSPVRLTAPVEIIGVVVLIASLALIISGIWALVYLVQPSKAAGISSSSWG